jgi:hypothetical protein
MPTFNNGPIYTITKIMRNVMSSAAEADVGVLFLNTKEVVPLYIALIWDIPSQPHQSKQTIPQHSESSTTLW